MYVFAFIVFLDTERVQIIHHQGKTGHTYRTSIIKILLADNLRPFRRGPF